MITSVATFQQRYRDMVRSMLQEVMQRPRMYFQTVAELETLTWGHFMACAQLLSDDCGPSFPRAFADFLGFHNVIESGAAGYAVALEATSERDGRSTEQLFWHWSTIFLTEWCSETGPTASSE